METQVFGATTYDKLQAGDVFIIPLGSSVPHDKMMYYLWQKQRDGCAAIFYVHHTMGDEIGWSTGRRHRRQKWPADTPVIQISTVRK